MAHSARPIAFALIVALVSLATACGDDGESTPAQPDMNPDMAPDMNPAPNNDLNPDPNPAPNPDMNPEPNPDPDPDMPDDVALCQATCTEVAACPGLVELCSEEILAQVEAGCQQGCAEDEGARAQILAAAGLPCEVVEPLAIDGFGLNDLCGGDFEPSEDLQQALDAASAACEAGCNAYAGDQCLGEDLTLESCLGLCDYETFFSEEFFDLDDETAIACANAFTALEVCLEVLSCEDVRIYFTTDGEEEYPCQTEDEAIFTECEGTE